MNSKATFCPICYSCYQESNLQIPHILECGHTTCKGCLTKILQSHKPECPICRQVLKKKSISEFPKNYIAIPDCGSNDVPVICKNHQKPRDIICIDCKKIICYKCTFSQNHQQHKLVELDEFQSQNKHREELLTQQKAQKETQFIMMDQFFRSFLLNSKRKISQKYKSINEVIKQSELAEQCKIEALINSIKDHHCPEINTNRQQQEINLEILINNQHLKDDEFKELLDKQQSVNRIQNIISDGKFNEIYSELGRIDELIANLQNTCAQNSQRISQVQVPDYIVYENICQNISKGLQNAHMFQDAIDWEDKFIQSISERSFSEKNQELAIAYYNKARIIEKTKKFKYSYEYYQKSINQIIKAIDQNISPETTSMLYDLVINKKMLEIIKKEDQILDMIQQHHQDGAQTVASLCIQGLLEYKRDQKENSLKSFERAIQISPLNAPLYRYKGLVFKALNQTDKAIELYMKSTTIDERYIGGWHSLANLYNLQHRNNDALNAFNKAIEIDSEFTLSLYGKAMVLENMGKDTEALQIYEQINKSDPNYVCAWNNKGILYKKFNQKKQALEAYNKAIEIDENYTLALYNKGLLLKDMGQIQQAKENFLKVLQITPEHADSLNQIQKMEQNK